MIPLGNTDRTEGYGAPTGRNGSADRVNGSPIKFPKTHTPPVKSPQRLCPKCGGHPVRRSRRRVWEKMTNWFHPHQRMFRCYKCRFRFWDTYKEEHSIHSDIQTPSLSVDAPNQVRMPNGRHYETSPQPSVIHRLDYWLYRKHGLNIGTVILLMIMGGLVVTSLLWAMGTFFL